MEFHADGVERSLFGGRYVVAVAALAGVAALLALTPKTGNAESPPLFSDQPPPPCHPNPNAAADEATVANRGDVKPLPDPIKQRLLRLAGRPHTYLPLQVFAEADSKSLFFQYYLLETHPFQPNVFTARIRGVNDQAMLTVTGGNCGLPTIGSARLALEPKPDLPTDPNDPGAFIDVFIDISPLFVINNESGWYEGWMIHDLTVPEIAPPRPDGHAQFGKITGRDADILRRMGTGHNVPSTPGHDVIFTMDGKDVHFPKDTDRFVQEPEQIANPDLQTNVVPIQLSMGAFNAVQQGDSHQYWEFNYQTNWIHPLYELPFTGGFPDDFNLVPDALADGELGQFVSVVAGSMPALCPNAHRNPPQRYGDNPDLPRDPDKFDADVESQRESRERFIPSGLANEILLDVYVRRASFAPREPNLEARLCLAYTAEVARVDTNGDNVISAAEGDIDTASDGFENNERLFIPATKYGRFAVTREINDGILAPRFAPSQRAWVVTGRQVLVSPAIPASEGRDADDR